MDPLSSFQLKMLAMIWMILDHIYLFIPDMPIWFTMLGRVVAPIFFFLIVEGFFHTRSRVRYASRLFIWALIMYVGSTILVHVILESSVPLYNNIFLSLALAVILMMGIEWIKEKKEYLLGIPIIFSIMLVSLATEASFYGIYMTLIFYFLRNNQLLMAVIYVIVSAVLELNTILFHPSYEQLFLDDVQWMMIFAAPFFLLYNGKRGWNHQFVKYLFYVVYPAHIWIIYLIRYATSGVQNGV